MREFLRDYDDLASMTAGDEHVVELFLLAPGPFLLICLALLAQDFNQRLVVAMGSLVHLQLLVSFLFEGAKTLDEGLLSLRGRLHLAQECMQLKGRNRPLHGLFPHRVGVGHLRVQLLNLIPDADHLMQDLLEFAFLALFRVLPNQKHSRKWETEGHS